MHKIFRYPKLFDTPKCSPTKFFGTLRQKIFEGVFDTSPSFLSINFFVTRNFLKRRRVPLRNFSVLWDNKFSIESRDIPLLGINFFDTRNFLKHRRVPRRNFSALWDKNFSTENLDTPAPLLSIKFSLPEIFWKRSIGFLYEIFGHCETKNFRRKILILPPPLPLIQTFSIPELNERLKGFPTAFFGTVRRKKIRQKIVT